MERAIWATSMECVQAGAEEIALVVDEHLGQDGAGLRNAEGMDDAVAVAAGKGERVGASGS